MRAIRMTSPVKTLIPRDDHEMKPEEGQLVMRRTTGGKLQPWTYDLDKSGRTAALQGLFRDG